MESAPTVNTLSSLAKRSASIVLTQVTMRRRNMKASNMIEGITERILEGHEVTEILPGTYAMYKRHSPIPLGQTKLDVSVILQRYSSGVWLCQTCEKGRGSCPHIEILIAHLDAGLK